ncbi:MAG: hypothetical protein K9L17_04670 [Clostridiales bacterium]|nr:hypothetical protein [Clostridiales bacterium]MCF8021968.1 hypothetical protein [Clostridiales bacterium]
MGNINASGFYNNKSNFAGSSTEGTWGNQSSTMMGQSTNSTTSINSSNVSGAGGQVSEGGKINGGYQINEHRLESSQNGQRNMNAIINASGQAGDKASGVMSKVGAASSFPIPEVHRL